MQERTQRYLPVLIIVLLILVAIALATYVLLAGRKTSSSRFFRIDKSTGQFRETKADPTDPVVTDVNHPSLGSDRHLGKVLKGYFHSYDPDTNSLQLKNEFFSSQDLQLLQVSVDSIQNFYCWPGEVEAENGPVETKSMYFFVYPSGQDIVMPGEITVDVNLFDDFLYPDRYLILQLTDTFRLGENNEVQKLILLDC